MAVTYDAPLTIYDSGRVKYDNSTFYVAATRSKKTRRRKNAFTRR